MPIPADPVVRAREQERRRLACELHDECGQHLTALRLYLDALRVAAGSERLDQLDRAIGVAMALDESLEAIAHDLRPPALDAGVGQAVAAFARRWSMRAGVPVDLRGVEAWDHTVPEDVAIHLYRTVQEGLQNIARHAAATRVVVRLARTAAEVSLMLVDDGVGFSGAAAVARRRAGGFGLVSLQERAAAMNGRLEIVSAPGRGTTLSLCAPLPPGSVSRRSPRPAAPVCLPTPA